MAELVATAECASPAGMAATLPDPRWTVRVEAAAVVVSCAVFAPSETTAHRTLRVVDALFVALAEAARRFGVRWSLASEGERVGEVGPEGPDTEARALREEIAALTAEVAREPWAPLPAPKRPTAGVSALRKRWTPELAGRVLTELYTEGTVREAPFAPTAEGRVDLRGLDLSRGPAAVFQEGPPYVTIAGVDLSGSVYRAPPGTRLPGARYLDCALDGVDFGYMAVGWFERCSLRWLVAACLHGSFSDCDLTACRISRVLMPDGDVARCRFDFARLRRTQLLKRDDRAEWLDCSFRGADLTRAELVHAVFRRCHFEGACFYDAFYGKTVFEQCEGLDVERMFATRLVMMGYQLGERDDLRVS